MLRNEGVMLDFVFNSDSLYENIDSKETLLNLLVDDIFDSITEKGKEILNDATIDNLEKLKRIFTLLPTSYDAIDYTKIHEVKKFYPKIYEKIMNRLDLAWEHTNILVKKCIDEGLIKKVNIYLMKSVLIGSIRIILEDNNLRKEINEKSNWIKLFGIYNTKDYLMFYLFGIKISFKMNENRVNKLAWWIPIRKWRDNFRNKMLNI